VDRCAHSWLVAAVDGPIGDTRIERADPEHVGRQRGDSAKE